MSYSSNLRLEITQELNRIPDDRLTQVLQVLRGFSTEEEFDIVDHSSNHDFQQAIAQLENPTEGSQLQIKDRLQQLFQDWDEMDSLEEQKASLEVFQSLEKVAI